jgi:hypothetical protein
MLARREQDTSLFRDRSPLLILVLVALFAGALAIRLTDLTDLPLDFNPTRQMRSALIARGMYYQDLTTVPAWQRDMAVSQWHGEGVIEPQILEWLVAQTYRLAGGEHLWIARLYSIAFWLIGGVAVYGLARELTSADGAVGALALYLFLPFGAIASRSFQPEALMIMLFAWALWALVRWQRLASWPLAIATGLLMGAAILVKAPVAFLLFITFLSVSILGSGLRASLRHWQFWAAMVLAVLPTAVFLGFQYAQNTSPYGGLDYRFFPSEWIRPIFYVRWLLKIQATLGAGALLVGLAGALFFLGAARPFRALVLGLWLGYLAYGLSLPYHIASHDYYQLPLLLILAVSAAPLAAATLSWLGAVQRTWWYRTAVVGLLALAIGLQCWQIRYTLVSQDYRGQAAFWQGLGDKLRGSKVMALTNDYGYSLEYWGWINPLFWPSLGDLALGQLAGRNQSTVQGEFSMHASGARYFLVTDLEEYARQPDTQTFFDSRFRLVERGDGFLLYDLTQPKTTAP